MILPVGSPKFNLQNKNNKNSKFLPKNCPEIFNPPLQTNGNFNISFGKICSPNGFKVKNIKNLRCPICGQVTIKSGDERLFIFDVIGKKGKNLVSALEKYEDESVFLSKEQKPKKRGIYRQNEQEVVNIIKDLALKHPYHYLDELVSLKAGSITCEIRKQQAEVLNNARKYANNKNVWSASEAKGLFALIKKHQNCVLDCVEDKYAKKRFEMDVLKFISDEPGKHKMLKILSKLPELSKTDLFFLKYSAKKISSASIAQKLIESANITTEHLDPKSMEGLNDTKNYIADCLRCNFERKTTPFDIWMQGNSDLERNLNEYLRQVQKNIDNCTLPYDYVSYPDEVIDTIKELSLGKIKLQKPSENPNSKRSKMLLKRKARLRETEDYMNKLYAKKEELTKKINEVQNSEDLDEMQRKFDILDETITHNESILKTLNEIYDKVLDEAFFGMLRKIY